MVKKWSVDNDTLRRCRVVPINFVLFVILNIWFYYYSIFSNYMNYYYFVSVCVFIHIIQQYYLVLILTILTVWNHIYCTRSSWTRQDGWNSTSEGSRAPVLCYLIKYNKFKSLYSLFGSEKLFLCFSDHHRPSSSFLPSILDFTRRLYMLTTFNSSVFFFIKQYVIYIYFNNLAVLLSAQQMFARSHVNHLQYFNHFSHVIYSKYVHLF